MDCWAVQGTAGFAFCLRFCADCGLLPAFFLGMYEKNGQPLEKLLSYYVQSRFVRPKIRPYKTNNYYALLMKGGMTHDPVLEKDR